MVAATCSSLFSDCNFSARQTHMQSSLAETIRHVTHKPPYRDTRRTKSRLVAAIQARWRKRIHPLYQSTLSR